MCLLWLSDLVPVVACRVFSDTVAIWWGGVTVTDLSCKGRVTDWSLLHSLGFSNRLGQDVGGHSRPALAPPEHGKELLTLSPTSCTRLAFRTRPIASLSLIHRFKVILLSWCGKRYKKGFGGSASPSPRHGSEKGHQLHFLKRNLTSGAKWANKYPTNGSQLMLHRLPCLQNACTRLVCDRFSQSLGQEGRYQVKQN